MFSGVQFPFILVERDVKRVKGFGVVFVGKGCERTGCWDGSRDERDVKGRDDHGGIKLETVATGHR